MDYTSDDRQQKFREKLKLEGKKGRTFYLSDSAMDSIKKRKAETESPSLNYALESLLTTPPSSTLPEVVKETVTVYEPTAEQKTILDQAKVVADTYRLWEQSHTQEHAQEWKSETIKLAEFFG